MTKYKIIPKILNDNNYKVGVEVGTFKGEFSKTIIQAGWLMLTPKI